MCVTRGGYHDEDQFKKRAAPRHDGVEAGRAKRGAESSRPRELRPDVQHLRRRASCGRGSLAGVLQVLEASITEESTMPKVPTLLSVMTPFPYSIERDAPLRKAREMMSSHEVRHLPVMHAGELVGVLTDRDLKRALDPGLGLPPKDELFVDDVMVFEAFVVDASAALDGVLLEMADRHIGCALVSSKGRLAGIFTTTDACREFGAYLRVTTEGDEAA